MRKVVMRALRIILAIALFSTVFYFVSVAELLAALSSVTLDGLILLSAISVALIWVSALKWQLFIRDAGHDAGIRELMSLYTMGYFFSTFTPSFIGGDVIRSVQLGNRLGSQRDAFIATFFERFTGLLAMAFLGFVFVCFGSSVTQGLELAIFTVALGATLLGVCCFSEVVGGLCERLLTAILSRFGRGGRVQKTQSLAAKVFDGMKSVRKNKLLFAQSMALSLVYHTFTVINTYLAARVVGWDAPDIGGLFVVVPLVLLVSMAPITPNGVGIQEGAFVFFLERIGCPRGIGLATALILRAKVLVLAALGALLWARMKPKDIPVVASELSSKHLN